CTGNLPGGSGGDRFRLTLPNGPTYYEHQSAGANVALAGPGIPGIAARLDWRERPRVVSVGKEVTACVVATRGGSSDEQPTGCWPVPEVLLWLGTSVSQILS